MELGTLLVSLDNLLLGVYEYNLTITDHSFNSAVFTTIVNVTDTTDPLFDSLDDFEIEIGSTNWNIIWSVTELKPASIKILQNGSTIRDTEWFTETYPLSSLDLEFGVHNFTMIFTDSSGNSATATVFVTVIDTVAPIVDSPADMQYNYTTTQTHQIEWVVSDFSDVTCQILLNGTEVESGTYRNPIIRYDLLDLDPGTYVYTLVVTDQGGNSVSDEVTVVVVAAPTGPTGLPSGLLDPLVLMVIIGAAIGVIVIIIVVIIKRK